MTVPHIAKIDLTQIIVDSFNVIVLPTTGSAILAYELCARYGTVKLEGFVLEKQNMVD